MRIITPTPNTEGGNAVTMTLLGLAVAILAGVFVLYWIGKSAPERVVRQNFVESVATTSETTPDPRAGWQLYVDAEYSFSVQIPPGWLVATGTIDSVPVISLAPGVQQASSTHSYHNALTRISVYPHGFPHVLPPDAEVQSVVILQVPQAVAKDYVLGSKRAWATVGRFEALPLSWKKDGYVFARVVVEDESVVYMRGEVEITADTYDPLLGDKIVRKGFVDPAVRTIEEEVLKSFQFVQEKETHTLSLEDGLQVELPRAGDNVTSPLTVRGRARGGWYFEGVFPVRLETNTGEVIAEVSATAQGDWMTEEFVPFELSLVFPDTVATSGVLILSKDSPSGIPEVSNEVRIPVSFVVENEQE